jgi:hypothetical protein
MNILDEAEAILKNKKQPDTFLFGYRTSPGSNPPEGVMEPLPFNECHLDHEYCLFHKHCFNCFKCLKTGGEG